MRWFLAAIMMLWAAPAVAKLEIAVVYLRHEVQRPPVLSNLDPIPADLGWSGAELAVRELRTTGSFLGHDYKLSLTSVAPDADFLAAAREVLRTHRLLLVDAPSASLLAVADLPEAKDALLINVSNSDGALRGKDCRANLLHTLPEDAARADALMQYLQKKQWRRLVLLTGPKPADQAFAAELHRAAAKFGMKIAAEKNWSLAGDLRESTMKEIPRLTQDLPDHDVLLVADPTDDWGRYIEHNTWLPRPVAGSHGLVATAWSHTMESWGGVQLQNRFEKQAKRPMRAEDWAAWIAMRGLGAGVTKLKTADATQLRRFLLMPDLQLDGFKGRGHSFRAWNGQLRQPIALVNAVAQVGMAPFEGFLHQHNDMDTLGLDRPESGCKAF